MALDQETIDRLLANKRTKSAPGSKRASTGGGVVKRKLSRTSTHWAKLPHNSLVYPINEYSLPCTSSGCGAPSNFRMRGSPLCNMHLVFALAHEINLLSHNGENRAIQTSGVSEPSRNGSLVGESPQSPHNGVDIPLANQLALSLKSDDESGEDDDNSYL
jgi:hypothetical protein